MKNYYEQVKADVRTWIEDNAYYFNLEEYRGDRDGAETYLNDNLWTEDSVTGNGSGSYTFNSEEAKEHVLNDMDTVKEAVTELGYDAETIAEKFLNEDWEWFDVLARCYVLGSAIYEVCDELESDGVFDELEEEDDENDVVSVAAAAIRDVVDTYDGDEKEVAADPVLA